MVTAWEFFVSDTETPPYSGWPGAFDSQSLGTYLRVSRPYLAAVDMRDKRVVRLILGPRESEVHHGKLDEALREKMHEIGEQYPHPDYDILFGSGTIRTLIDSAELPYSAWRNVQVEELVV